MMDKSLEKIFRYIDGEMNSAEMELFQVELKSNSELNKMYLSQLNIHRALSQVPTSTAPAHLADNVMSMVTKKKFSTEKFNSFSGLKNIAIGAVASVVITIALGFIFSNETVTGYSMGSVGRYLDGMPDVATMTNGLYAYSKYICISLIVPLLIILDGYLQKRNAKSYSISEN